MKLIIAALLSQVILAKPSPCQKNSGWPLAGGDAYVVGAGDSCSCIADNLPFPLSKLIKLNPFCDGPNANKLQPGDVVALSSNADTLVKRRFRGTPYVQ